MTVGELKERLAVVDDDCPVFLSSMWGPWDCETLDVGPCGFHGISVFLGSCDGESPHLLTEEGFDDVRTADGWIKERCKALGIPEPEPDPVEELADSASSLMSVLFGVRALKGIIGQGGAHA